MIRFLQRLAKDKGGASLVEYSIVIGLIAAGTVATIQTIGGSKVRMAVSDINDDWQDENIRIMNREHNNNNATP